MTIVTTLETLVGSNHAKALLGLAKDLPEKSQTSWLEKMVRFLVVGDKAIVRPLKYKYEPVSIREFINSPFYLNKKDEIYPAVMLELEEINSGKYDEVVLTGGIGAAKTSIALYSQAFQVYLLSCMEDPHNAFGLDRSSEIKVIFQSLNKNLAKDLDFARFRSMLSISPYFANHFPFDTSLNSMMKFPNRIEVEPVSGAETAAIGQNVIGGIIDEVNFMSLVEKSKMDVSGGTFDQASVLYNTIARRRKSRFLKAGILPGLLCLVSSKRVPGQFTDKKEEEAKTNKRIYVYNRRVWEIKPEGTYTGEKFYVFCGDESREPRILGDNEEVADSERHLVDQIPVEYKAEFVDDITKALRDIAGRSTMAIHPYMTRREDVKFNFGRRKNLFVQDKIDFSTDKAQIRLQLVAKSIECPRFGHIDLGLTSDSAGLVIAHVDSFVKMDRNGYIETLPRIVLDAVLEIVPPKSKGGEIDFASIRRILYKLRDLGMPLKWVSLDSYQSADTMQILRQQGFKCSYQSIDTTNVPYDLTKQALYDHRIVAPKHDKLLRELICLERDFNKGKVDHPAHGSKDIADALAGVVYGLTTRIEIWQQFSIPVTQATSVSAIIREEEQEKGKQQVPIINPFGAKHA